MDNATETARPLPITEYKNIASRDVWAMQREMNHLGVMALPPTEWRDHAYVLTLEDYSSIYLSAEQAKAIALAVAKVAAGES